MKETFKERAAKLVVGVMFFIFIFLSLTLIGYFVEVKLLGESIYSYMDYLLYLLGYGDIGDSDIWFRLFFSVASLIALSLLSSACTVTWLESRRILSLGEQIIIRETEEGGFVAAVRLKSKKRDVYGAKIALIINASDKAYSEETDVVYIPKNDVAEAVFEIGLNSVVYKYFRQVFAQGATGAELVVTAAYSDIVSGESFSACRKYTCGDPSGFAFLSQEERDSTERFRAFVLQDCFPIDLSEAEVLDSTHNLRSAYAEMGCFPIAFHREKEYKNGDFQMLFVPIPEVSEWGVYHDMGCKLTITLGITEDICVAVEIKRTDGSILKVKGNRCLTREQASLSVDLADYKRSTWENIKELCFTVFYENVSTPDKCGTVVIEKCAFVLTRESE